MNRTQQTISPQWKRVITTYQHLQTGIEKQAFMNRMSPRQRHYFLQLVSPQKEGSTPSHTTYKRQKQWWAVKLTKSILASDSKLSEGAVVVKYSFVALVACIGVGAVVGSGGITSVLGIQGSNTYSFDAQAYASWVGTYSSITDTEPTADPDFDGLTNTQEHALGTNPTLFSTRNNGMGDGIHILNNLHPADGSSIPVRDAASVKWYNSFIDRNELSQKILLQTIEKQVQTSPKIQLASIQLEIPRIGFSQSVSISSFDTVSAYQVALQQGVVSFDTFPQFSDTGATYLAGEFPLLDVLEARDSIIITYTTAKGSTVRNTYRVYSSNMYDVDDEFQFQPRSNKSVVALSTQRSDTNTEKMLVVKAERVVE